MTYRRFDVQSSHILRCLAAACLLLFLFVSPGSAQEQRIAQLGAIEVPQKPPAAQLGTIAPSDVQVAPPYIAQQAFQRRIGQIFVRGNTVTKDRVVRQYLELSPGDIADLTKLRTSQQNLIETRLFAVDFANNVFPRVDFAPTNDPYSEFQDVVVTVQETQTGSYMFGGVVNSDLGVSGGIFITERNFDILGFPTSFADLPIAFRGAGQEFRLQATPGSREHNYQVSFREPRLLGLPVGIGASGYYFRRNYSAYDEERASGKFNISRQFGTPITGTFSMRIEEVKISDPQSETLPDLVQVLGSNTLFGLGISLEHDTRDSHLRPTEGHLIAVSAEQVLGDFDYPRLLLSARQHWMIFERPDRSGRHVLTGGVKAGYTGSHTPIYERYYAGGLQTLRGFQFRGVSPVEQDVEVGGDFLLLANLEYQLPISADDQWHAVFFVDSGTVERDIEIRDYRVALGFGLRLLTPFTGPAPLAVDIAFPVSRLDSDDKQLVSFFLGFFP